MTISLVTSLGVAGVNTGDGNPVITVTASVIVGQAIGVIIAKDNVSTTDGTTSEITSVTDSQGNPYVSAGRFCNSQGAANAGAYVEMFVCERVLTGLTISVDTITVTKSTDVDCAIAAASVTLSLNKKLVVNASATQTLPNDGADAGSMVISGLSSLERLYFRAIANELENATNITPTATFTASQGTISSTSGLTAANMRVCGEFKIATSTGETSDPTLPVTTGDVASIFVAFEELDYSAQSVVPVILSQYRRRWM